MLNKPLKYAVIYIICCAIIIFTALSPAYCAEGEVNGAALTDSDIARAALKNDWPTVAAYYTANKNDIQTHLTSLYPLFAYSLLKNGDKNSFLDLLNSMPVDATTHLLKAVHDTSNGAKGLKIEGIKSTIDGAELFVIKKNKPKGSVSLGILPTSTASSAVQRAFDSIITEPTDVQLSQLDNLLQTELDSFFLGGAVVYEDDESAVCVTFVDTGKLKKEFNAGNSAKTPSNGAVRVGVLTKTGSDKIRKEIFDNLTTAGYKTTDLGRGEFYSLGDRTSGMNVIVEISAEAKTSNEVLGTKFKNIEGILTLNVFSAATGKKAFDMTERATVVSIDEFSGKETSVKKSYDKLSSKLVSSLSSIKDASSAIAGASAPVELNVTAKEVFSSSYKYYATNPFGTINIRNNSQKIYGGAEITFTIKGYMDYPTVIKVGDISPGGELRTDLIAVFSEKILDLTDDSFLQSSITLTYYEGGKTQKFSTSTPIFVYEKHALVWDDKAKIASFITPKDAIVVNFASNATTGYKDQKLNKNIVKARAVFAAMGVAGISYKVDPNNPFEVVSGLNTVVDYVQFPRETIARKVGDCDDLTSLYASALESMGIRTILIDAPGHVFMMFDTGVPANEAHKLGFPEVSYVVRDGEIWIPIETTLSGFSFTEAWKAGLKNYNKWKSSLKFVDLGEARKTYKSPNLGKSELKLKIGSAEIEKKFPKELAILEEEMREGMKKTLEDLGSEGLLELMILNAEKGDLAKAMEYADKLVKESQGDAVILNNVANVYYLNGDYAKSAKHYKEALALDPEDAGILVNLSRAYLKNNENALAKSTFDAAMAIDPSVKETFYGVYMEVYK